MPFSVARERVLAYLAAHQNELYPPSWLAGIIWPGHTMRQQGAAFAAGGILNKLRREGVITWGSNLDWDRWGWQITYQGLKETGHVHR